MRADLSLLAPFFLVAAAVVPVTVFMEEELIDLVREDFEFSWGQRFALAARALLFYPQKLLIPYPLIFNYPRWNLEAGTLSVFWPVAVAALLALALVVFWRRGWRGSVCALVFYVIVVSPALGFFNVYAFRYSFVADHWQYLASIGPLILIVQAGSLFGQRFAAEAPVARGLAGAVVVLLLGALTWNQAHAYSDSPTLWRDTIAKNPDSWIAHHEMGLYYTRESRFTEALHSFDEALRVKPHAAESYTGRGSVYAMRGEIDRAFEDLDRAIQLTPRYPHSHLIRGNLRLELEQFRGAVEDFDVVLAAKPDHFRVRLSRGTAKQGLGDDAGACEDWLRACVMNADRHEIDCRLLECLRDGSGR